MFFKLRQRSFYNVAESVLTDDKLGYFKEEPSGEILEEDSESGEGSEDEQEIVKELAMDILFSKLKLK